MRGAEGEGEPEAMGEGEDSCRGPPRRFAGGKAFIDMIAAHVLNKMFECGLVP
jgi:hypothetical protein